MKQKFWDKHTFPFVCIYKEIDYTTIYTNCNLQCNFVSRKFWQTLYTKKKN